MRRFLNWLFGPINPGNAETQATLDKWWRS